MNFYKHHLGDYDGHTTHLTWDEDMAYTRLLRAYYRRESPIPDAEKYRFTRAGSKSQRAAVDTVLAEFFNLDAGVWHQKRCDEEIAAYQAQAETNRRIARSRQPRTNRERTVNEPSTKGTPNQNQNQNQNQIPDTNSQEPRTRERAKTLVAAVPLPDWLNADTWKAYIQTRPARSRTAEAQNAAIAKLEGFRASGHDANSIVATSLANGWQGLFEPEAKRGALSLAEKNRLAGEEAQRRFEEEHASR